MIKLTKKTRQAIIDHVIVQHAMAEPPHEACGLIVMDGRKQIYLECDNTAPNPHEAFEIEVLDYLTADNMGEVVAVVHSHPNGEPFLSSDDREHAAGSGVDWVLVVGSQCEIRQYRPVPRLRGRVFEYGRADCSVLLLDASHLAGIDLPDHPRTDMAADAAAGYLLAHAETAGFVQVFDELQPGDVVLTTHRGLVGHAAIYIGNNELLHHAYEQLSRREPYGDYWRNQTHSVWRHPQWQPEMIQAILNDLE